MLPSARRAALCGQALPAAYTGIDFIRVADPETQVVLQVFFVVDPSLTETAPGSGVALGVPGSALDLTTTELGIRGAAADHSSRPVVVEQAEWVTDIPTGRTMLEIRVEEPGDFSEYALTIEHPALDWVFRTVRFSFKQGCAARGDCESRAACAAEQAPRVNVDYAARDFDSLRSAVLDFAAQHYPQWGERVTADGGVMLIEVLCALADEFSYMQDRLAREAHFATATQRRSLNHMARLVDYDVDQGSSATALLTLTLVDGESLNVAPSVRAGQRMVFWALTEGTGVVPFEVVVPEQIHDSYGDDHFWLHSQWNEMAAYTPDVASPCLSVGATSLHLAPMADGRSPLAESLDPASPRSEVDNWIGRQLVLRMDPADPSRPHRVWVVTVTEVQVFRDPLVEAQTGGLFEVTKIGWGADRALPFELSLPDTRVHGNNLTAVAGRTVVKYVRTGDDVPAAARGLQPAIIREAARYENAIEETASPRGFSRRAGLEETAYGGLAFAADGAPYVTVETVDGVSSTATVLAKWSYIESLLEADEEDEVFTLESGLWTEIRRFERAGQTLRHADYASNRGFTVVFGDGVFGARPADNGVLRVTYRLNPGALGNVPSRVVTELAEPGSDAPALGGDFPAVEACTNWLPAHGGRDPESPEHIRRFAPHVYRSRPLRAVVDEDYHSILGRLSFVQAVGVKQRWTGSWLTRFLTADPLDSDQLSDERREMLLGAAHSVRQVGRHITAVEPRYRPIDLAITICVEPAAYFGQVKAAVLEALMSGGAGSSKGLFHPDHFSFGSALSRSSVEAVVQRVPGVLGVERICVRAHPGAKWREFTESAIAVGAREIIQLRNDARFPDQGMITIHEHQPASPLTECSA